MPFFKFKTTHFHYQEMGSGEAIIVLHGLSQNTAYWMDTGVAELLSGDYHVIALDLRAHGKTSVDPGDPGYDIETMQADIGRLADHLGLEKFHLLGHSTGGMIAVRYAMHQASLKSGRLLSLILTNCSSSTSFVHKDPAANAAAMELLAEAFETLSWPELIAGLKLNPGLLFAGVAAAENSDELFAKALGLMAAGNSMSIAAFSRCFYNDPDPMVEGLNSIECPTLIISAELDWYFSKSSELMTQQIPDTKHVIGKALGHMTALEAPEWLAGQILEFLSQISSRSLARSDISQASSKKGSLSGYSVK
ncbi:MAG: alpha/beta hydrolase [Proteobacteria bacterium]|nr:alpha/beta hydrolase [Pseudomonadota bacterium]